MTSADRLATALRSLRTPAAVGLSGYGGSGKSTLSAAVASRVEGLAVVSGDDFLDPAGCTTVTDDWGGLDRARLDAEVLTPFRRGEPARWRRMDWTTGRLAQWRALPPCEVLLVEGIGVLHPLLRWDFAVWLACDPLLAQARGTARDHALYGVDHEVEWREIWGPTDLAFEARFAPADHADLVLGPCPEP